MNEPEDKKEYTYVINPARVRPFRESDTFEDDINEEEYGDSQ